ncbi:conserved hypothetical protein [Talaromyces stipitatus ATCC 10500]|uniref:3-carboxymuconate cyclase n=1 Tax=Talaromyces stipitatus (strain ATCC 10500 / CBS 375.48 / QM 6759 / NRRL 1006) TaxID=441959 RepID=B8M710_TALSN|nr:uncharacterized protein TSTA_034670 [Talaromyces stipitatus ATCC 10500]EED20230.1 conserved hypothetical protein [Talaromyces stipitatus ATCC 10500]
MLVSFKSCITNALLVLLATAHPLDAGHRSCEAPSGAKAIYFLTNEHSNSVVAIAVGANGTLSGGVKVATGGNGGSTVNSTGGSNGPDALGSQSALTVVDNYLFAVNPGSNTLSMMKIASTDATDLKLIGKPVAVSGQFPVTVAASSKNRLVCVGTTGAQAAISCASYTSKGLGSMSTRAVFDLNQTTPPSGPLNGVAHTFFSADETRLFTTVKGDPTSNKTGFVSVLPIENPSAKDTRSSPNGTAVLFGASVLPGTSNIFVTDASFGAGIFHVNPSTNDVSLVSKAAIQDQKATCWAAFSKQRGSVFVSDVANNHLVEMSAVDSHIISTVNLDNGDPGLIDLKVSGRFVYALSPGNGTTPAAVTVVDSSVGKQIQHFHVSQLGAGKSSQGMAVLE